MHSRRLGSPTQSCEIIASVVRKRLRNAENGILMIERLVTVYGVLQLTLLLSEDRRAVSRAKCTRECIRIYAIHDAILRAIDTCASRISTIEDKYD